MREAFNYGTLRLIGVSFFGVILIYNAHNPFLFDIIKPSVSEKSFKSFCLILGLALTVIINVIEIIHLKIVSKKLSKKHIKLLGVASESMMIGLQKQMNIEDLTLKTRIFKAKKLLNISFRKNWPFVQRHMVLAPVEIDGLTTKYLRGSCLWSVYPKTEGIVGIAFNKAQIKYDLDVSNNNSYETTQKQKQLTNDVRFCIAAPLFKNEKELYGVASIDSNGEMTKEKIEEFREHFINYVSFIDEYRK